MKLKLIVLILAILCTLGTMVAAQEPDYNHFVYFPYIARYPIGPTLTPSPTPTSTPRPTPTADPSKL